MTPQKHAKAVRARLMSPPNRVVEPPPAPPTPKKIDPLPLPKVAANVAPVFIPERKRPRIGDIVEEVAKKHSMSPGLIRSESRLRRAAFLRFEVIYIAIESGYSLGQVGAALDRDHTSILHGYRRFQDLLKSGEVTL